MTLSKCQLTWLSAISRVRSCVIALVKAVLMCGDAFNEWQWTPASAHRQSQTCKIDLFIWSHSGSTLTEIAHWCLYSRRHTVPKLTPSWTHENKALHGLRVSFGEPTILRRLPKFMPIDAGETESGFKWWFLMPSRMTWCFYNNFWTSPFLKNGFQMSIPCLQMRFGKELFMYIFKY